MKLGIYFKFIGGLILYSYLIGVIICIYQLEQLIGEELDVIIFSIVLILIYIVIAPALGLLFRNYGKQLIGSNIQRKKEAQNTVKTDKVYFPKKEYEWICECGFHNKVENTICKLCDKPRKTQ